MSAPAAEKSRKPPGRKPSPRPCDLLVARLPESYRLEVAEIEAAAHELLVRLLTTREERSRHHLTGRIALALATAQTAKGRCRALLDAPAAGPDLLALRCLGERLACIGATDLLEAEVDRLSALDPLRLFSRRMALRSIWSGLAEFLA